MVNKIEDTYPFIVNDVMKYIDRVKESGNQTSLLDIIMDYSIKNNIEPELIGDAIMTDVYFKSFVEKDCQVHNMLKSQNETIEEW